MSYDLTDHQLELLARVLQHGGVLSSPFGHSDEDSLLPALHEEIAALEEAGLITVTPHAGSGQGETLTLTEEGYAALDIT
ncbi:hypothetical protein HOP52_06600 [Halomonas campisalis]|uniref:Uncharacterized protein n=1 Tax=Billgrantia campisalis TaxID=74661 RepID=A0ABS9P6N9_9GAMM|nr:hypothetical protein [Halomonas campisalis]MCG6657433.1 hypothetical protein [Halomonas campisalis]MDR5863222.1 hypothetical protein [Halomonas campisalis]